MKLFVTLQLDYSLIKIPQFKFADIFKLDDNTVKLWAPSMRIPFYSFYIILFIFRVELFKRPSVVVDKTPFYKFIWIELLIKLA